MNRYRLVAAEATMNVTTAADAAQCLTMVAAATPAATTVAADLLILNFRICRRRLLLTSHL